MPLIFHPRAGPPLYQLVWPVHLFFPFTLLFTSLVSISGWLPCDPQMAGRHAGSSCQWINRFGACIWCTVKHSSKRTARIQPSLRCSEPRWPKRKRLQLHAYSHPCPPSAGASPAHSSTTAVVLPHHIEQLVGDPAFT
jgi:hypothetical protein